MNNKYPFLKDDFKIKLQQDELKNRIAWENVINDKYDKLKKGAVMTKLDGTPDFRYYNVLEDMRKKELKISK